VKWGRTFFFAGVFAYLYVPMGVLVVNAFNTSRYGLRFEGFTLSWFRVMFQNAGLMEAARHSLIIAFSAATLSTVIGALSAIAFYRYRFLGRKMLQGILMVLMMTPDIVLAIALLVLFVVMGMALGFWSLLLAHITFCIPFVVVTVMARIQGFDPFLLDAGKDLGAGEFQLLYRIVIPLLRPALLGGWLLSFTLSMDDVIVSSFTTGPSYDILPLKIFSMVKVGVKPEVNALATLLILLSLLLVLISQLLLKERIPYAPNQKSNGDASDALSAPAPGLGRRKSIRL
jgi:spermidine/putrescine transport system permease protein